MFNLATKSDIRTLESAIKFENDARWRLWREFQELKAEHEKLLELLGINRVSQPAAVILVKKENLVND